MARVVLASKIVYNAAHLAQVLEQYAAIVKSAATPEEISIEEPVTLIETTLTDGSKVYDIHLG